MVFSIALAVWQTAAEWHAKQKDTCRCSGSSWHTAACVVQFLQSCPAYLLGTHWLLLVICRAVVPPSWRPAVTAHPDGQDWPDSVLHCLRQPARLGGAASDVLFAVLSMPEHVHTNFLATVALLLLTVLLLRTCKLRCLVFCRP